MENGTGVDLNDTVTRDALQVWLFHTHQDADLRDKNCTVGQNSLMRSYLFDIEDLRDGWVAINCLVTLYMFVILAIISARYFVPAIEKFTHDWKIHPNVAGAGIMATAASVPTFANNIVGMFVARNDIGLGAVVGGSFFNLFFIPAVCGIVVPKKLELQALPMIRDLLTFILSSILVLFCIQDKYVTAVEATVMLVCYVVYFLSVIFYERIEHLIFGIAHRARCCCKVKCKCLDVRIIETSELTELVPKNATIIHGACEELQELGPPEEEYHSVLSPPKSWWMFSIWLLLLPVLAIFYVIIPDFQRPGWGHLYPLTIVMSLVLIGGTSYIIVWMISIIGMVIDAPVTVMGMTLLAVGSNLPDAFNSLFAARDGFGEMALSNAFGTLNAGLLLCLAAPWLLALVITPDNPVAIEEDLLVSVAGLVLAGTLMIVVLVWNHWTISQNMCYVFIILYLGFLVPLLILQVITEAETKNEAN